MKKKLSQILLVSTLAIFTVIGIVSCGDKNVDKISKTWKIKSIDIEGEASMLADMDSNNKAMYKNFIVQIKEKASFTFTKDSTFTIDMVFAKQGGTYKISKDGKTLLMTTEIKDGKAGKEDTMSIEFLSADKFVMKQKDPSGKNITFTFVPGVATIGVENKSNNSNNNASLEVSKRAYRAGYKDGTLNSGDPSAPSYQFYLGDHPEISGADVYVYQIGYNDAVLGKPAEY